MERKLQRKLAQKINVSDAFISQILNGKRRPSWTVAKRLAQATNTKPELWLDSNSETIKAVLTAVNF